MIAKPFSPGNAFPAEEVAREHLTFDKALIGSCTNGSYDDLLQAALVLRAARTKGATRVERELAIFPDQGALAVKLKLPICGWVANLSPTYSARLAADQAIMVRAVLWTGA